MAAADFDKAWISSILEAAARLRDLGHHATRVSEQRTIYKNKIEVFQKIIEEVPNEDGRTAMNGKLAAVQASLAQLEAPQLIIEYVNAVNELKAAHESSVRDLEDLQRSWGVAQSSERLSFEPFDTQPVPGQLRKTSETQRQSTSAGITLLQTKTTRHGNMAQQRPERSKGTGQNAIPSLRSKLFSKNCHSVTFEEVRSDSTFRILGDNDRVGSSTKWYIIWCRNCKQDFNGIKRSLADSAINHLNSARHLSTARHPHLGRSKDHSLVIEHLGVPVLNCTAKKALSHNGKLRQLLIDREMERSEEATPFSPDSSPTDADSDVAAQLEDEPQLLEHSSNMRAGGTSGKSHDRQVGPAAIDLVDLDEPPYQFRHNRRYKS